jgi:nitrilase
MRHIAHEGRCFVASACQYVPSPETLGVSVDGWDEARELIAGGSMIAGPMGDVLAGPLEGGEGLITAEIDTDDLAKARYDFDVVGHYSRPDIFELRVNETPRPGVSFQADEE